MAGKDVIMRHMRWRFNFGVHFRSPFFLYMVLSKKLEISAIQTVRSLVFESE